ncbi:unnamed protein product [Meloidogyne enterolobii]|uniref:Uncharacterized protein n=1 Tax=Meloidogyne enterolobii TaxID=390850 RepID=A0ACB1AZ78_MELEN
MAKNGCWPVVVSVVLVGWRLVCSVVRWPLPPFLISYLFSFFIVIYPRSFSLRFSPHFLISFFFFLLSPVPSKCPSVK